ncbi:MAG: DUF3786 domain-containing protein [Deltaproteobacteria bacterium]|jgi:hypothetical protein|nr:DUF3786 domain-containing protein [Deltaproteobacteria bacterium]
MTKETASGYEKNYEGLTRFLKGHDFAANNARLGLTDAEGGGAVVNFLGRDYVITEEGVRALDGKPSRPNDRSILIHYAISKAGGEPGKEFLSLHQLPGHIRGNRDPGKDILNKELVRRFEGASNPDFERAAKKVGGTFLGEHPSGGKHWHFDALPKLHMRAVFSEADDEFPVDLRVFFDSGALDHMGFECLAFLNGCLCDALVEAHLGKDD